MAAVVGVRAFAARAAEQPRNFIWKVARPGGGATSGAVYVVGSIHLLTSDYYPLSPALDAAFKDSDLLVEEADLGELTAPESQMKLLTRGMLPAGQSVETVVSPATYALVAQRAAALGLPVEPLRRFKPWMLALTLVELEWQRAGFDASLGLDRHFYDRAKADGRPVRGLETVDFQLSLFDDMTPAQQDMMLAGSLKNVDAERANLLSLTTAWKAGDARTVERLVLEDVSDNPTMYRRLLIDRNRSWLPAIEALFARAGHAFVVVGAAHLVGPDGLIALLHAKGYAVTQL
ncbi:MAG: TraB/GumN family protein [Acidobacteriota bacterium]